MMSMTCHAYVTHCCRIDEHRALCYGHLASFVLDECTALWGKPSSIARAEAVVAMSTATKDSSAHKV